MPRHHNYTAANGLARQRAVSVYFPAHFAKRDSSNASGEREGFVLLRTPDKEVA